MTIHYNKQNFPVQLWRHGCTGGLLARIRMKIKPYRIKHKPTGLYYYPGCGRTNLTFRGKVYKTKQNAFDYYRWSPIPIYMYNVSRTADICKRLIPEIGEKLSKYSGCLVELPREDFEIEYL